MTPSKQRADTRRLHPRDPQPTEAGRQRHPHHRVAPPQIMEDEREHCLTAAALEKSLPALLRLHPGRVVFNPGTESAQAQAALDAAGIPWQEDCTLVMLRQGRF